MTAWEYCLIRAVDSKDITCWPPQKGLTPTKDYMEVLEVLGRAGWEAFGMSELANPAGWSFKILLKREVRPAPPSAPPRGR
jgi:hypothetical protein